MGSGETQDPRDHATDGEGIILPRLIRSLLVGSKQVGPGKPIPIDLGYITGEVDAPRPTVRSTCAGQQSEGDDAASGEADSGG